MGLIREKDAPLAAPASTGYAEPDSEVPSRAEDAFFADVNAELADKGFLVTASDDLVRWARTGSLMWMTSAWPAARWR